MRMLPALLTGASLVWALACGEENNGEPAPDQNGSTSGVQPADVLAEEVLHARWDCACQPYDLSTDPNKMVPEEPVAASSGCVASIVPGALRQCEQPILEQHWDDIEDIGTCQRNAYRAAITCLTTGEDRTEGDDDDDEDDPPCDLEDCYFLLSSALDRCGDLPANVLADLAACAD